MISLKKIDLSVNSVPVFFVEEKMCCAIPIERKAQPMPASANFPGDWKFVIDPTMEGYLKENCPSGVPEGLKLLPPSSFLTYYSVERAQARLPFALKDANATAFYDYIGVDARPAHEVQTEGSFAGQKGDCGTCETCQKAPCGRCFRCRSGCNESCFQKVRSFVCFVCIFFFTWKLTF